MPRDAIPDPTRGAAPAGARGFDFLLGRWTVRHRRRKGRLVGSTEWVEFDGTCRA